MTNDYKRTLAGLAMLGVGPWRVYTCSPTDTTNQTYRGKPTPFTIRFCYADITPGGIVYEVIQPISGPTIFQNFLDKQGEGVHHIAYDCNNVPMKERVKIFAERGLELAQGGSWRGDNHFAFFESEETGTCFETIEFAGNWEYPEPDEWFPAEAGETTARGSENTEDP